MPAGRPSPYKPDFARIAERLCRNGATDIEVADILGISVRTFYRWCLLHDEFTAAVRVGKDAADDRVARARAAQVCDRQAAENAARFKAAVETEVSRRLSP